MQDLINKSKLQHNFNFFLPNRLTYRHKRQRDGKQNILKGWPKWYYSFELSVLLTFILTYYINTSEIPSELSRENFISSYMKITCYLHMWRDHRRYGYIINRAFESKLIRYFTGVYIINRILHTRLWIWILPSRVELDKLSHSFAVLTREISTWPLEDKIHIHARTCNILYLLDHSPQTYKLRLDCISENISNRVSTKYYHQNSQTLN